MSDSAFVGAGQAETSIELRQNWSPRRLAPMWCANDFTVPNGRFSQRVVSAGRGRWVWAF
ncbi:MAG: hypothetical protein KDE51_03755 [Anaerolineales bacterium]|nr:hypothetical protein [Anaerolineales bacterium]